MRKICLFLIINLFLLHDALSQQKNYENCYWQTCREISAEDTISGSLESRIFVKNDSIFHQKILINIGAKGNRISKYWVLETDTFLIQNDSIFWKKNGVTGLFFNKSAFEKRDTIHLLKTRGKGLAPQAIRYIPVEIAQSEGDEPRYKYKSYISNDVCADNYDFQSLFKGLFTIDDGYYYIHPILGIIEREKNYHTSAHVINQFYSNNNTECDLLLEELEKRLKLK